MSDDKDCNESSNHPVDLFTGRTISSENFEQRELDFTPRGNGADVLNALDIVRASLEETPDAANILIIQIDNDGESYVSYLANDQKLIPLTGALQAVITQLSNAI